MLGFQYLKNRAPPPPPAQIQIVPVLVLNFLEEPSANARKIEFDLKSYVW